MLNKETIHSVANTLNDAGFLKVLFPLLALIGPALFLYFGVLGVVKKRTLLLGRRRKGGAWLTGTWAVVWGVLYLLIGPLLLFVMGPIAAAMLGLW